MLRSRQRCCALGRQVEGLQVQMAAEYALQEQALLERIARLEK